MGPKDWMSKMIFESNLYETRVSDFEGHRYSLETVIGGHYGAFWVSLTVIPEVTTCPESCRELRVRILSGKLLAQNALQYIRPRVLLLSLLLNVNFSPAIAAS